MKPTKLIQAEFAIKQWYVTPTEPFDALMDPSFWGKADAAKDMRPGDRIEVLAEDGSYWGMLLVRSASRSSAVVVPLDFKQLTAEAPPSAEFSGFEVKWAGPQRKFRAMRIEDKAVLRDGFDTKEQGETWLRNYMRSIAA